MHQQNPYDRMEQHSYHQPPREMAHSNIPMHLHQARYEREHHMPHRIDEYERRRMDRLEKFAHKPPSSMEQIS